MALKYVTAGAYEISKSLFPILQVKELQKFIPSVTEDDVMPGPAGVRAQALDMSGMFIISHYIIIIIITYITDSQKLSQPKFESRCIQRRYLKIKLDIEVLPPLNF